MNQLEQLHQQVKQLIQARQWEELLALDEQIREAIESAVRHSSDADRGQLRPLLQQLQADYTQAISGLQQNQGQSASNLRGMQRGLRAARSYLDSSKL